MTIIVLVFDPNNVEIALVTGLSGAGLFISYWRLIRLRRRSRVAPSRTDKSVSSPRPQVLGAVVAALAVAVAAAWMPIEAAIPALGLTVVAALAYLHRAGRRRREQSK
jgi:peptidoglycan biosynthesis protein MviN/MurJ (putative lipid II flippase)